MASTTKPTILLSQASYPSIGPGPDIDPALADCAADTKYVLEKYLLPIIEAGKDVVIFAHSYGGMPAAGAATGLTKRIRSEAGQRGGVIGLIMASAFVVGEGNSCAGAMGGDTSPWVLKDNPKPVFSEPDFKALVAYIKLTEDQAVPVLGQEAMLRYSGVEWVKRELPLSHNSGFVTKTSEMAGVIDELIGGFKAAF